MASISIDRRKFLEGTVGTGAAMALSGIAKSEPAAVSQGQGGSKRIRVGVIGCGSVSHRYFPHLSECPFVELVSACDIIPERAANQAKSFKVPNHYPHIDQMLAGAKFDLL